MVYIPQSFNGKKEREIRKYRNSWAKREDIQNVMLRDPSFIVSPQLMWCFETKQNWNVITENNNKSTLARQCLVLPSQNNSYLEFPTILCPAIWNVCKEMLFFYQIHHSTIVMSWMSYLCLYHPYSSKDVEILTLIWQNNYSAIFYEQNKKPMIYLCIVFVLCK